MAHDGPRTSGTTAEGAGPDSIFRWETLREVGPLTLPYQQPVSGKVFAVELVAGATVEVFRPDDGLFYFCHGLTFGGKHAPGGPVSPFSGRNVRTILDNHYRRVEPESAAAPGDILVWRGLDEDTPHSAILTGPAVRAGEKHLDFSTLVQTKNGRLPEAEMTLERLTGDEFLYGDSLTVFRREETGRVLS